MTTGVLTKISINQNALRTISVEGTAPMPPTVGLSFVVISLTPLDTTKDFRQVTTSIVQDISRTKDGAYLLTTLNSTYEWRPDVVQVEVANA